MSRRNPEPKRRRTSITIPDHVGPHVKLVFAEMRRQNITYDAAEEGSGVRRAALKAWRNKNKPSLDSIEAVLGFLGFDLVPVPRSKVLPREVVAALQPIADGLGISTEATVQALVEIVSGIHGRFGVSPAPQAVVVPFSKPKRARRFADHPDQPPLFEAA